MGMFDVAPSLLMARLRRWWPLALLLLLPLIWLLPADLTLLLQAPGREEGWPQIWIEPAEEGVMVAVRDREPWPHVRLTVAGQPAPWERHEARADGTWQWWWHWPQPLQSGSTLIFYHHCDTGCQERGRRTVGKGQGVSEPPPARVPTKLCVVFPDPERRWHGRSGWGVELTYAMLADEPHWGVDDLAMRVQEGADAGLRMIVRVDYAQGQSVPPAEDYVALDRYLRYLERLARDERLAGVYAYQIGSGYNAVGTNQQAAQPVSAAWYARLFNGYGEAVGHTDNVLQRVRAANPQARVWVGPVQPWNEAQGGPHPHQPDVPWLTYMNTLVAALDEGARAKSVAGVPAMAPDGFALHVPGRPDAPELGGREPALEPRISLPRPAWGGAQVGFRVYEEWLAIINTYPTTGGVPAFITATNTFTPDAGTPPAQSYPTGWLTSALAVVNEEPQIQALCWFLDRDRTGDGRWDLFSLHTQSGRLLQAAEEFDALLQE